VAQVVNALLTQLDKLKSRKNCLVMTTSNLSGAIDNAFIDRADIKQYIGLCVPSSASFRTAFYIDSASTDSSSTSLRRPPAAAVYWILQGCLNELMRAGLIPPVVRPFLVFPFPFTPVLLPY
jgi:hypothetical protein